MINNFLKKLIISLLLINLTSCGFQVIYKDQFDETSIANKLASIKIKKNREQLHQKLKSNLLDVLNPDNIKVEPKYLLEVTFSAKTSPTFTNITGASGRNKLSIIANYDLRSLDNLRVVSDGKTEVYDSYDVDINRYGTYSAEEFVKENLTKVIAQNIRNLIVSDLTDEKNP